MPTLIKGFSLWIMTAILASCGPASSSSSLQHSPHQGQEIRTALNYTHFSHRGPSGPRLIGDQLILIPDQQAHSSAAAFGLQEIPSSGAIEFEYRTHRGDQHPHADGFAIAFGKDPAHYRHNLPHWGSAHGYVATNEGYGVHLDTMNQQVYLVNAHGGILLSRPFQTTTGGQWHHIRLQYDGQSLQVFVNRTFVMEYRDPSGTLALARRTVNFSAGTGASFGEHAIRQAVIIQQGQHGGDHGHPCNCPPGFEAIPLSYAASTITGYPLFNGPEITLLPDQRSYAGAVVWSQSPVSFPLNLEFEYLTERMLLPGEQGIHGDGISMMVGVSNAFYRDPPTGGTRGFKGSADFKGVSVHLDSVHQMVYLMDGGGRMLSQARAQITTQGQWRKVRIQVTTQGIQVFHNHQFIADYQGPINLDIPTLGFGAGTGAHRGLHKIRHVRRQR